MECAWKNMWKILNRIKNFEYSILTAEILYPKAETTNANGAQTLAVWAFLIYCLFLGIINCPDRVVPKKQSDPDNYLRMKNYHSY